jgi:hypothetical protein
MEQKELLTLIQDITKQINDSIDAIQKHHDVGFHVDKIKSLAIQIHQSLSQTKEIEKPKVSEIKIIKKEELTALPELTKEPIVEPIKSESSIQNVLEIIEETPIEVVKAEVKPTVVEEKVETPIIHHQPKTYVEESGNESGSNAYNDILSKSGVPPLNIADKLKETPIKDLAKSIAISKKFEFINTLFDGKSEDYKNCINFIQNASSYQEAISYLDTNVIQQFDWQNHEKLSEEFFSLVRRKFLS